jgi:16S rRNA (cytidine1402-2'-O)-methyltransferase
MGKLYIVGPMEGSWQDVPLWALQVLRNSSLIVAQDIGSAVEWLQRGEIHTPLLHICGVETIPRLLEALRTGDVAWLFMRLVDLDSRTRHLFDRLAEQGTELISVPGPCSAVAALAVSGMPVDGLTYLGALPDAPRERSFLLQSVAGERQTIVCEVTADGLEGVLVDVLACLGDRRVLLYKEHVTWRGWLSKAIKWPGKGWFTLVIEGAEPARAWSQQRVGDEIAKWLASGASTRDIAREVARRSGWPRKRVYRLVVSARRED